MIADVLNPKVNLQDNGEGTVRWWSFFQSFDLNSFGESALPPSSMKFLKKEENKNNLLCMQTYDFPVLVSGEPIRWLQGQGSLRQDINRRFTHLLCAQTLCFSHVPSSDRHDYLPQSPFTHFFSSLRYLDYFPLSLFQPGLCNTNSWWNPLRFFPFIVIYQQVEKLRRHCLCVSIVTE